MNSTANRILIPEIKYNILQSFFKSQRMLPDWNQKYRDPNEITDYIIVM